MNKQNYGLSAIAYVQKNYKQTLILEEVAQHFHLNKCYFCSVLKKELGKTFTQIVNEVRIEKSKKLLLDNQLSILEIALSVGYINQNYFNMTFKKMTGITPLNYRRSRDTITDPRNPPNSYLTRSSIYRDINL